MYSAPPSRPVVAISGGESRLQNLSGVNPNFHCGICNISFSSQNQKSEHDAGRRHKNKAAAQGIHIPDVAVPGGNRSINENFRCEACDVCFSSANQHAEHNQGKKHKAKAALLGLSVEEATTATPGVFVGHKRKLDNSSFGGKKKKKGREEKYFNALPLKLQKNLTAYAAHFLPLIDMELTEELVSARSKLVSYPIRRLQEDGLTMVDLEACKHKGHKDYFRKTQTEAVYRIALPNSWGNPDMMGLQEMPKHDICPGDIIWLSNSSITASAKRFEMRPGQVADLYNDQGDYLSEGSYIEGVCISRTKNYLVFVVDPMTQPPDLYVDQKTVQVLEAQTSEIQNEHKPIGAQINTGPRQLKSGAKYLVDSLEGSRGWRIDKGVSRVAYERMKEAITILTSSRYEGHMVLREIVCRIKAPKGVDPTSVPEGQPDIQPTEPTDEVKEETPDGENTEEVMGQARVCAVEDWTEAMTPEGHPYYFNAKTGQTAWLRPQATVVPTLHPAANPVSELLRDQNPEDLVLQEGINQFKLTDREQTEMKDLLHKMPLNESQKEGVESVFSSRLSLIQGPPGTGKTTTAVHLVACYAKVMTGKRILASAFSNVAVDQMMHGLLSQGVKVVRVGEAGKVSDHLRQHTLQDRLNSHPEYAAIQAEIEQIKQMTMNSNNLQGLDFHKSRKQLASAWKKVRKLEEDLTVDILRSVDVICSTCIGAGTNQVRGLTYDLVVVDECTQATEPSCLIPLVQAIGQVVLIGDQCQLPPTLMSEKLKRTGLQTSLFERMIAPVGGGMINGADSFKPENRKTEMGVIPALLKVQYRMHPLISYWPNHSFYGGNLQDGVVSEDRIPPKGFAWPNDQPVTFVCTNGREDGAQSKSNEMEAFVVKACVDSLLSGGEMQAYDIGVISPYSGQVQKLRHAFQLNRKGGGGGLYYGGLEVSSVDGYQGREKEVIVFSCVRSNENGSVGFLADVRRLNVAITRAKRGLIVIGNPETLRRNPTWASYIRFAETSRLMVSADQLFSMDTFYQTPQYGRQSSQGYGGYANGYGGGY